MKITKISSDSITPLTAMVFIVGNIGWALKFCENGTVKMIDCNAPEIVEFLDRYTEKEKEIPGED